MTEHPGIVNGTRIGSNCYSTQLFGEEIRHHLGTDQPGSIRCIGEIDRFHQQTEIGQNYAPFPREMGVEFVDGAWVKATDTDAFTTWTMCADLDIHVLWSNAVKDNLGWSGDGWPSSCRFRNWRWQCFEPGLMWASPNLRNTILGSGDLDGGALWYNDIANWLHWLDGLAAIRDLYGVTLILDAWNEIDLRPASDPFNPQNAHPENRHGEWQSSYLNRPMFGFTGGLERWGDMMVAIGERFDEVGSGGVHYQAWSEKIAPHASVNMAHVYGDQSWHERLEEWVDAWEALGVSDFGLGEVATGSPTFAGAFSDERAIRQMELLADTQGTYGAERVRYWQDHTANPWPWKHTTENPTGFGRWWLP